jgi:hypothetical protein
MTIEGVLKRFVVYFFLCSIVYQWHFLASDIGAYLTYNNSLFCDCFWRRS